MVPARSIDHGPMNGSANGQRFFAHAPIVLAHAYHLLLGFEWPYVTVEHIATALQREPVQIAFIGGIRGLGPSEPVGEALPQGWEADPHGAVTR